MALLRRVKNAIAAAKKGVRATIAVTQKPASLNPVLNVMMPMKCVATIARLRHPKQSAVNPRAPAILQNTVLETLRHAQKINTEIMEMNAQTMTFLNMIISFAYQAIVLPGIFNVYNCWKTPLYESTEMKLMSAERATMTGRVNCHA